MASNTSMSESLIGYTSVLQRKANKGDHKNDDAVLIQKAETEALETRLITAARLLEQVNDRDLLKPKHHEIIRWAHDIKASMMILFESPEKKDSNWIKQTESHGDHNFFVYYQLDASTNNLYCRIESAIKKSLLHPIISVFNESNLYKTWMPSWDRPFKLGFKESKLLRESGIGNQIIQVITETPFGIPNREVVFHAVAVDVMEEKGAIVIQANSATHEDDPIIPQPLPGVIRVDFELSMLIRGCPSDHPCYPKREDGDEEEIFLISMKMTVDTRLKFVPTRMINFVTRTVIGRLWAKLLQVAEDVRDGKMPSHSEAINRKKELYDWLQERLDFMIELVKEESQRDSRLNHHT